MQYRWHQECRVRVIDDQIVYLPHLLLLDLFGLVKSILVGFHLMLVLLVGLPLEDSMFGEHFF